MESYLLSRMNDAAALSRSGSGGKQQQAASFSEQHCRTSWLWEKEGGGGGVDQEELIRLSPLQCLMEEG